MSDEKTAKEAAEATGEAPPSSRDEVEPLSSRDVELEPVSLRDIEMILAPGRAPPMLSRSSGQADGEQKGDATGHPTNAGADSDAALAQKRKGLPPPKKTEAMHEVLERAKAPLPPEAPRDSGLEDLRQLVASHPPPAAKKNSSVDFDMILGSEPEAPAPLPPLPPDLSSLLAAQDGDAHPKAKAPPKPPLKKRDKQAATAPSSERPRSARPASKRPGATSERPRTTGVPAKSIEPREPSQPPASKRPAPPSEPARSGSGRLAMMAAGGLALLGIGYLLGRSSVDPTPAPSAPASSAAQAPPTATAPSTLAGATAIAAPIETAEPSAASSSTASATASVSLTTTPGTSTSTSSPTATGAIVTATTKPSAQSPAGGEFDKAAASAALNSVIGSASGCKQPGDPSGKAQVSVTFAPSGRVTSANVNGPPFAGTATGGCIAKAFRAATVPPFSGDAITVSKSVNIP